MYPDGGAVRGYLEAGRSFHASGFQEHAREAFSKAMATWEAASEDVRALPGVRRAVEEVRQLMAELVQSRTARSEGAR